MSSPDSSGNKAKKCPANEGSTKVGEKKRQRKHDKRWSMKKKKAMKEKNTLTIKTRYNKKYRPRKSTRSFCLLVQNQKTTDKNPSFLVFRYQL